MQKSYWAFVWEIFLRINGFLLGFGGIGITLLVWMYNPDNNMPLKIIIPIALIIVITLLVFIVASNEAYKDSSLRLPKLLCVKKVNSLLDGNQATVLLLEPSELFSFDSYASLFYIFEEGFEQLIAIGTVTNIQIDKKIQVSLNVMLEEHREILQRLTSNDLSVIKKVIIKPNIPKPYIQIMNSEGV